MKFSAMAGQGSRAAGGGAAPETWASVSRPHHENITRHRSSPVSSHGRPAAAASPETPVTRYSGAVSRAMSKPPGSSTTAGLASLALDDVDEDLFASPDSGATTQKHTPGSNASSAHRRSQSRHEADEARDAQLRAELERVREVNQVITGVTADLTKAKDHMDSVHRTVQNASTLLATWTRILSQTEHNQRLILLPQWQGAARDLDDMENEDLRRQQETERRALEEKRGREEAQRKAEEEEARQVAAASTRARGVTRTRSTRGAPSSTRGYVGVGGPSGRARGAPSSRTTSGVTRGSAASRGRGRGVG